MIVQVLHAGVERTFVLINKMDMNVIASASSNKTSTHLHPAKEKLKNINNYTINGFS
jgi:hypothetical protein